MTPTPARHRRVFPFALRVAQAERKDAAMCYPAFTGKPISNGGEHNVPHGEP